LYKRQPLWRAWSPLTRKRGEVTERRDDDGRDASEPSWDEPPLANLSTTA
jgi:hypothetical protein